MKKYIIVVLSIIWTGLLHAQTDTNYLHGKITGKKFSPGSKIEFLVFNPDHISVSLIPDTVFTTLIDSTGRFSLTYTAPYPLFYMGMDFYNGTDSLLSPLRKDFLTDPFICQVGDSIFLNLKILPPITNREGINNKSWFSGKGADKYNAQYLINHYEEAREARGPFYTAGPFSTNEPITNKEQLYLLHQQYRLGIANAFKDRVPDTILTRIKQNIIAMSKYWFTKAFIKGAYSEGSPKAQQTVTTFVNSVQQPNGLFSRSDELIGARGYADFILLADELKYRMKHQIHLNGEVKRLPVKDYSAWMYNNLKNNYKGSLRENLLTTWLIDESVLRRYFYELEPIISEAKNLMINVGNRSLMDKVIQQRKGSEAHPFKFIDQTGKIHTLADYKDKIYVLDFWYTGCLGCTGIPPIMKIIMEEFKDRKDVVFLSISVDAAIKMWQYGLSTGLYTVPGQIHLKTFDRARTDPFILNYRIGAYPKVMVIGKNSILLAANPIDPRSDNGKDIINMIKKELKK